MTYNTTRFLTEATLLYDGQLSLIDAAETVKECEEYTAQAFGIVLTLRTFANCLSDQDQIDDIYDLMARWEEQIQRQYIDRLEELGADAEQEP